MLVKGSVAVPLAALLKMLERFRDKTIVAVPCGAKVSLERLKAIL
jgi:threonine dehydratase